MSIRNRLCILKLCDWVVCKCERMSNKVWREVFAVLNTAKLTGNNCYGLMDVSPTREQETHFLLREKEPLWWRCVLVTALIVLLIVLLLSKRCNTGNHGKHRTPPSSRGFQKNFHKIHEKGAICYRSEFASPVLFYFSKSLRF